MTEHWAYNQGFDAGKQNKTTERGLMAFGLSCAATAVDADNIRQWLKGFDDAIKEPIKIERNNRQW